MAEITQWRFADAVFDTAAHRLTVAGQAVELERRPARLLALLLAHAGEVVTKDEILDHLWPDREVSEASLTTCVARLRQGLRDTAHTMVKTVHGYGYRFAVPASAAFRTPDSPPPPAAAALAPGQAVPGRPNFVLVRRLGSGGFGEAWLAEQAKSHEQRVFKFALDPEGLAALRREIALSRLLHEALGPRRDLVRILDWRLGEMPQPGQPAPGEPPFIEIAYYPEGNLAEWMDRQGGAQAVPLATRLELAAQIADALAAIHSLSILHKDLKPANILIRVQDGQPAVALTDFGSGRALNAALFDAHGITRMGAEVTAAGSTAGTQAYAAPELASGAAPTLLADIYALGVILFQLAAGDMHRPLAPGWEARIGDAVLCQDIAQAAAGDPAHRLGEAAELARRLRSLPARHAALLAAAAAQADLERTRRALELARARRAPLLALVAALAVFTLASTSLYVRAERAQARAEADASRAEAVTRFLTEDVFSAANPLLATDPNAPVRSVLAAAAADLNRRFPHDDLDRATIAQAIGGAYAGLSDRAHATPLLQAALATFAARLGAADPRALAVHLALGDVAERAQDFAAMRREGQTVLAAHPADAPTRLAAAYLVIEADCGTTGNGQACVAAIRPIWQEARRALGRAHTLTLHMQSDLAFQLSQIESTAEAITLSRETVALTTQAYGPDHLLVQERLFQLGEVLVAAGQPAEAAQVLTRARTRLLAAQGGETDLSARCAEQLGHAYLQLGRPEQALQSEQIALATLERARGQNDPMIRVAVNNIANIDAAMGRMDDAIAMGRRAYALQRAATGENQADTLWFANNVANFLHLAHRLPEAEAAYRDVVARGRLVFTQGEWDQGHFLFHLGEILAEEGRPAEARPFLVEGIARLQSKLGADSPRVRKAQAVLAALH